MGAGYLHKCRRCDYEVSTSGPWEFYRDTNGERKPYGHPCPMSIEAEESGIHGLSADLYCPTCDDVRDVIVVEFKEPSKQALSVWSGSCEPKDEFKHPGAVRCPVCGNPDLVLGPEEGREVPCPRCKDGKLVGSMVWIS